MDPGHPSGLPSVTAQSFQPQVHEQPSPSVGSDHAADNGGRSQTHSSTEKPLFGSSEGHSSPRDRNDPHPDFEPVTPPGAARSRDGNGIVRGLSRLTATAHAPRASGLDYLVPILEKPHVCVTYMTSVVTFILILTLQLCTLGERLAPTIINAKKEREQYAIKG